MTQDRPLTGKQQAFVDHYTGDCFYNKLASAKAAGYAPNAKNRDNVCGQLGHKLVKIGKIRAAIDEIKAKKAEKIEVSVEFIVSKLMKGLSLAESKQDLVAMARFSELLGKYKAMFTENVRTTTERQRELSEKEKAEAREIATIRLRAGA